MRELLPFSFETYEVTAAVIDGEPLFSANEVAIAVGYSDYRQAVRNHCKRVRPSPVPLKDKRGQTQHPNLIPESDVYRLIFRSRLPSAEHFMDWVSEEVLPTLRRDGHYAHEGSDLDRQMQKCTVGYRSLMEAYGMAKVPTSLEVDRLMRGFNATAKAAGLPAQYQGVAPDPEVYLLTPAMARTLITAYGMGKVNGTSKVDRALAWLDKQEA